MHLTDKWLIKRLESIDSTQEYAKQLITDSSLGSSQQVAITSAVQTAGYGRLSREWQSLEGNLHLTLIVPVPGDDIPSSQISYVTGIATGETISSLISNESNIQYKWVNDILIDEKKVSGILIEKIKEFFIIGIGVNLMHKPEIVEGSGTTPQLGTTSLLEEIGKNINSDAFITAFLPKFTFLYNQWMDSGFETLRNMWRVRAYKIGKKITIKVTEEQNVEGIFTDISPDGEIIMNTSDGIEKLYTGDFFPLS